MWLLHYFNFERNYDVLKSNSPCILLNKNINFNKNTKWNLKWKIPHSFRETNLDEPHIKISWSSRKKKESIFYAVNLSFGNFLKICCALSHCRVYWMHFQNRHTFMDKKITSYTFLFFCLDIAFKALVLLKIYCSVNSELISKWFRAEGVIEDHFDLKMLCTRKLCTVGQSLIRLHEIIRIIRIRKGVSLKLSEGIILVFMKT